MTRPKIVYLFLCLLAGFVCCVPAGVESAVQPGPAVDGNDIVSYPERRKESNASTVLFPWPGEEIVFLTTRNDIDRAVMARLLAPPPASPLGPLGHQLDRHQPRPPRILKTLPESLP
jgi:hypothetical protein